jgi:hypothetical protein
LPLPEIIYVEWDELYDMTYRNGASVTGPPIPYATDWFYGMMKGEFYARYWKRICAKMEHLFGEPLVCQRIPTVRHYHPHEKAPYGRHQDTEFGHPSPLYNLWIPFTQVPKGLLHTATQENVAIGPGRALIFCSSDWHHVEPSPVERYSVDARFIPERLYHDTNERSAVAGVRIARGDYYT